MMLVVNGVTPPGTPRAFNWAGIGSIALLLFIIGLVLLGGLKTLLAARLPQPAVSSEKE
jgi:hypothetical protein